MNTTCLPSKPEHDILVSSVLASYEGLGVPTQIHRLTRAFAARIQKV